MKIRHLKGVFPILIHIHVQNNVMCYAFEGHINVGWGPHPVLGPPVGQPWFIGFSYFTCVNLCNKIVLIWQKGFIVSWLHHIVTYCIAVVLYRIIMLYSIVISYCYIVYNIFKIRINTSHQFWLNLNPRKRCVLAELKFIYSC